MQDREQLIIDEYTADEIRAALADSEDTGAGEASVQTSSARGAQTSQARLQLYGRGFGPTTLPNKTFVSDGNHGDKPAFNGTISGLDEPPEWFAKSYKQEKYEHRIMAFLKAQGYSNKEIAERTGYNPISVGQIMHLPWVVTVISEEIARSGREAVTELLSASAMDTVQFFLKVRDDEKAQLRDRITASKELLDRIYGKPNQPITHREEVDLNTLTDKELAQIATSGSGAI